MPTPLQALNEVIHRSPASADNEYRWGDLLAALASVVSVPLTSGAEHTLLAILRFEGKVRLDPSSEGPHRMSATDMLKSLAAQALVRWTGTTYVPTLKRLEATTKSSALAATLRAIVKQARQAGAPTAADQTSSWIAVERPHRQVVGGMYVRDWARQRVEERATFAPALVDASELLVTDRGFVYLRGFRAKSPRPEPA